MTIIYIGSIVMAMKYSKQIVYIRNYELIALNNLNITPKIVLIKY